MQGLEVGGTRIRSWEDAGVRIWGCRGKKLRVQWKEVESAGLISLRCKGKKKGMQRQGWRLQG